MSKVSVTEIMDNRALAPIAVSPVVLIAQRPHSDTRGSITRSQMCVRARAKVRGFSGCAPRTPDGHNDAESILFVLTNIPPESNVECV